MEETKPKVSFIKRHRKAIAFGLGICVLAAGGNYYIKHSTQKEPIATTSIVDSLITTDKTADLNGPVATVNGEPISRVTYQNRLRELTSSLSRQNINIGNAKVAAQIRQQAIAELVNFELLLQTAKAAGYTANPDDVGAEYQAILNDMGSEEVLLLTLADHDLTTTDLMAEIENNLIVDAYLNATLPLDEVTVTEEEVKGHYDTVSSNNPDLPSFESTKDSLTASLLELKKQQLVTDHIQSLRQSAVIEILL